MLKRIISAVLTVCILFTLGIGVFAAENNSVLASGESVGDLNNNSSNGIMPVPNLNQNPSASPSTQSGSTDNNTNTNINSSTNATSDGTRNSAGADGTNTNNTTDINNGKTLSDSENGVTNANNTPIVEENKTKHNRMLNNELANTANSRYSESRVALSPDILGTKYEEAAEVLGALGIMVGDAETGNFRPNDAILRSEMAKVAVYSIGLEEVANSSNYATRFPDVVSNHWANGAINVADRQGLVIGDDVGTFRPDDPVLFQEAVTIMVRALGYEPQAKANGGYPTGYMVVASSNQMLKGINAAGDTPATRGDIAQLIFNSLTINLMEQTNFGSDIKYEVVDKTLLYDRLNVEKGYGQIKGTHETTLTGGATTSEDTILINDAIFKRGTTNAKELLGYNVVYYARVDSNLDEKVLIVVRPQSNKNNSVTITADNIVEVTGANDTTKTISYWIDKETDKNPSKATIAAKPIYIFNGKYKDDVDISQLKLESGNLKLLDTDTNNVYDIVFINQFTNIVVDTVSSVTGRVTDMYANGSVVFDPKDTAHDYSIMFNNQEIEVSDLQKWDVLSITVSEDKMLTKAYLSRNSVTGTVTHVSSNGFRINNSETRYKKASSYPYDIAIRDNGTFYLDYDGKVAAVNKVTGGVNQAVRGNYAYLANIGETGTFEKVLRFKLFTQNGETAVLDSGNKIRVNDKYGLTPAEALAILKPNGTFTPQLVTFVKNSDNVVTGIDLARNNSETKDPLTEEFSLDIIANKQIYKSESGKLGHATITDETIVFDIPADAGTDTDKYAVRNKSMFANETSYDALIYDLQENFAANAVVVTSSTGTTLAESPIVIVDEISEAHNENEDLVEVLSGYENGERIELIASDTDVFVKNDSVKLKTGDIIQYNKNAKGEVDRITVLFDSSKKTEEFDTEVMPNLRTVYGRAVKKFTNSVNVEVNGTVSNFSTANAVVYLYDSTKSRNNISVVSAADIDIYEPGNEARVFLKLYKDTVQGIVIVK